MGFASILVAMLLLHGPLMKMDTLCMLLTTEVPFHLFLIIGHGRSDGYRNYINSMRDVVQDVCDFVRFIHKQRVDVPIFIMVVDLISNTLGSFNGRNDCYFCYSAAY